MPLRSRRATQPAPMTPPPMAAALEIVIVCPSLETLLRRQRGALGEIELLAHLFRADDPRTHVGHDGNRALHQLRIGGENALLQPEIVLQPDADIPAGKDSCGNIGHLVAAERKGRESPVRRYVVD